MIIPAMLAHYTMELGETIIKTAWWNEAAGTAMMGVTLCLPPVHCLPGNSTLCRLAPGWLSSQPECLETSHRHPPVCCEQSLIM